MKYEINKSDIYIPLWLDLLYNYFPPTLKSKEDLHSTMVRFIMID